MDNKSLIGVSILLVLVSIYLLSKYIHDHYSNGDHDNSDILPPQEIDPPPEETRPVDRLQPVDRLHQNKPENPFYYRKKPHSTKNYMKAGFTFTNDKDFIHRYSSAPQQCV